MFCSISSRRTGIPSSAPSPPAFCLRGWLNASPASARGLLTLGGRSVGSVGGVPPLVPRRDLESKVPSLHVAWE